ncbi:MAG: serine protease [Cryomorphaceae bacterium]
MRNFHSIANTIALFHIPTNQFLGSGFIFRGSRTLLTANHCVGELKAHEIIVQVLVTNNRSYRVTEIIKNPTADIAILRVDGIDEREIGFPKYKLFDDRAYGIEVMACGFPEETYLKKPVPTARVFRGHVQRFVNYKSHLGYEYLAAELSFRCPGGLSGGPVFNPEFPGRTYGLITENIRTSTILDSIEEVEKDGKVYREHYENIIYYGIALWLPALDDWIDSIVPPISGEEQNRWGKLQRKLEEEERKAKKK